MRAASRARTRTLSQNSVASGGRSGKRALPAVLRRTAKFRYLLFQVVFNSLPSVFLVFLFILLLYYMLYPLFSTRLSTFGYDLFGVDLVVIFVSFRFFFLARGVGGIARFDTTNVARLLIVEAFSLGVFALTLVYLLPAVTSVLRHNLEADNEKAIAWARLIIFAFSAFQVPILLSSLLNIKREKNQPSDVEAAASDIQQIANPRQHAPPRKSLSRKITRCVAVSFMPPLLVVAITVAAAFFFTLQQILKSTKIASREDQWYFAILVYGFVSPVLKILITYFVSIKYFRKAYLSSTTLEDLRHNDKQFILTVYYQSTAFSLVNKIILYSASADKTLLDFVVGLVLGGFTTKLTNWVAFIAFHFVKRVKKDRSSSSNRRGSRDLLLYVDDKQEEHDLLDYLLKSETLTYDMSIARFCYGMVSEYTAEMLAFLIFLFFPIITNSSEHWQMSNMNLIVRFACSLLVAVAGDALVLRVVDTFDIFVVDIDLPLVSHFLNCGIMAALMGIYISSAIHGYLTF